MVQDKDLDNRNTTQDISFTEINLKDSREGNGRFDKFDDEEGKDAISYPKVSNRFDVNEKIYASKEEEDRSFPFGDMPNDFGADDLYSAPQRIHSNGEGTPKNESSSWTENLKLEKNQIVGLLLTICWVAIALQYIINTNWWNTRFSISPAEFIGFFASMFLPVILIWLIIGYFEKTSNLKRQVQLLEKYMNKLVNPDESGSVYTAALTKTLSEQVIALRQTFTDVNQASQNISQELKLLIAEFKLLASKVDSDVVFSIRDLTEDVKQMLDSANMASGRAKEAASFLSEQINTLNTTSEKAAVKVSEYAESISDNIEKINAAYEGLDRQKEEMSEVFRQNTALLHATSENIKSSVEDSLHTIESEINIIRKSSDDIINEAAEMALKLSSKTEDLTDMFVKQGNIIDASTDEVRKKADILVSSFKERSGDICEECEKIIQHLKMIGDEITSRSDDTFATVDRSVAKIASVSTVLEDNSSFVTVVSEKACADIENSAKFMSNTLNEAQNSLGALAARTAEITDAATARCNDIINISDTVCDRISMVTNTVCEKISSVSDAAITHTKGLDNSISGMSSAFADLLAIVKTESEKLSDLSSLVVSQSRMAETSLIEQQKHISNSAARIEELKGELKLEILDLTKAVSIVDESSSASIARLKESMAGLMGLSDEVISRTTSVSSAISEGTENLDRSSTKALNTVEKIAGTLKQEGDKLTALGDRLESQTSGLEEKAVSIAEIIAKTEDYTVNKSGLMMENAEQTASILQNRAEKLDEKIAEIAQKIREVEEGLDNQVNSVLNSYNNVLEKVNMVSDTIGSNANAFSDSVEGAGKATESIAQMFHDIIRETENLSQRSLEEARRVSDKMKIILGEVNNTTYDSAQELLNAGEAFVKRADMIAKASETAAGKIKAIMTDMK